MTSETKQKTGFYDVIMLLCCNPEEGSVVQRLVVPELEMAAFVEFDVIDESLNVSFVRLYKVIWVMMAYKERICCGSEADHILSSQTL